MPGVLVNLDLFNLARETRQKENKYFVVLLQNCQGYVKKKMVPSLPCHPW